MRLSNPAQERARVALSLEQLTKADRENIVAVHLRRFTAALQRQFTDSSVCGPNPLPPRASPPVPQGSWS